MYVCMYVCVCVCLCVFIVNTPFFKHTLGVPGH